MAVCANCEHPLGLHGKQGCRAQYLVSDPLCGCSWHENATPLRPEDQPRRCRAGHAQRAELRCEIMVTAVTAHIGDHRNGDWFWSDIIAVPFDPPGGDWGDVERLGEELDAAAATIASRTVEIGKLRDDLAEATGRLQVARNGSARLAQVGGDHYRKYKIQPWDIWQEYGLDAFTGAIIKYLLRDKGNRLEDLKKARHTLDKLIEIEEGEG